MSGEPQPTAVSPWPHRLAWAMVCATFPLIWVGGLVTTYDAGMAVPDWPSTYGYNLFLYPWQSWIAGPWDLFIEHGHRLLAAAVGLLSIVAACCVWRVERRGWVRWAFVGAVAFVVFQGVLGGLRVVLNARQIAQVHGIVGPLFFVTTVMLAGITSKWWHQTSDDIGQANTAGRAAASAWFIATLALLQLVVGSQLRHVSGLTGYRLFGVALTVHLVAAATLLVHIPLMAWRIGKNSQLQGFRRHSGWLLCLVIVQILLGVATWVSKYGIPAIATAYVDWNFTVQAEGLWGSLLATAHVANGALVLAVSSSLSLRLTRAYALASQTDAAIHTAGDELSPLSVGGVV